jgi:hypothetical protein
MKRMGGGKKELQFPREWRPEAADGFAEGGLVWRGGRLARRPQWMDRRGWTVDGQLSWEDTTIVKPRKSLIPTQTKRRQNSPLSGSMMDSHGNGMHTTPREGYPKASILKHSSSRGRSAESLGAHKLGISACLWAAIEHFPRPCDPA